MTPNIVHYRHGVGREFNQERKLTMTDELTLSPPPGNEDLTARMETLLTQLSELTSQNHALQAQINEKRILDQMVDIARFIKIPEGVITHDLPRYLSDFVWKDGKPEATGTVRRVGRNYTATS
jgi:hypothetical protein